MTDDVLAKYGFQTNKLTKGWIIDNLEQFVDDMLWDELTIYPYEIDIGLEYLNS